MAKAVELVTTFNDDPDDDWTYTVVEVGKERKAKIAVYDKEGEYIGTL